MLAGAAFIDITGIKLLTGAFGIFFTGGIFSVTSFANPVIRFLAGHIVRGTAVNTFFEISSVVGTGVGRFLTFGTGGLVISFLAATFFVVKVIVIITVSGTTGNPMPVIIGIVAGKLIPRTVGRVGDKAGGSELDGGGVVKPSPTPP